MESIYKLSVEFAIKNIILYDAFGSVSGFVEFKIRPGLTNIKVRHDLLYDMRGKELQLSVVANGVTAGTFELSGVQSCFEVRRKIDAEREIFVSINKCEGNEVRTLASGVVNQGKAGETIPHSAAIQELDEAIRNICIIDENGKGQCETCPYREHFFGATEEGGSEVVG